MWNLVNGCEWLYEWNMNECKVNGKWLIGIYWNKIEIKKSKEYYFDEWVVKVIYI